MTSHPKALKPRTMESERVHYIPAGSLKIPKDQSNINPEHWTLEELQTWRYFIPPNVVPGQINPNESWLSEDVQQALLNAPLLKNYEAMFKAKYIKLEFSTHAKDSDCGTLRVYLLPDDVLRRWVDRSHTVTRANRQSMISSLDYSKDAWNGVHTKPRLASPPLFQGYESIDNEQDSSLLLLFNKIPSPMPDPDLVLEPHSQGLMYDILESNVPGLRSELYPYQRRSAALMFQKEVQPERIPDPRFVHVTDQHGSGWFLDPVEGGLLKEQRYYDGVSGGILAEEMGSGKTIICLALILATKTFPTKAPEIYGAGTPPVRERIASLADMAASCATRNAVPWKPYFDMYKKQLGEDFARCTDALERNPGHYFVPAPTRERARRLSRNFEVSLPTKVFLSSGSVVIVPNNLVAQWKQEIRKHTEGLRVLYVTKGVTIPSEEELLQYDIILFSQTRFEMIAKEFGGFRESPMYGIHFKRCIVDEGHKLGNSKISRKSNLLIGLDELKFSSRWIVTGTPSHGLFGVDIPNTVHSTSQLSAEQQEEALVAPQTNESIVEMERKDLERIGSIATLFLKARPWANVVLEYGDVPAEWNVYLMLPKHNPRGRGRWDCLRSTLNSLIIRHQLSDVGDLLPPVSQKVVRLDGSYQDQLSINIFSMMIIFNTVQSQRTDMDYFFHPKQRRSLLEIVSNLKQACFFGGSFFKHEEIVKAVETAERFLREKKVPISAEDEKLLQEALKIGHLAMSNELRGLSNQFHELPVSVEDLPAGAGQSWSLDGKQGNPICSSATMLLALQKLIFKSAGDPSALNSLLNGQLIEKGLEERERMISAQTTDKESSPKAKSNKTLAGNTKLGDDSPKKTRSHGVNSIRIEERLNKDTFLGPLEKAKITSTASAKLSYLIDSIVKYQEKEKIIVFYESGNVAWYLSAMLDVVQIQHLIYAKTLTTDRKAQYINTFHHNPDFRVLLMDITQAAFGLDMREASRIYFMNPILNPQVEAQAIGRVRRISQKKPVSVETLVLRNSIEEIILDRKNHMTQAEHRQVKSILDVRPIYDWIKYPQIIPLPEGELDNASQMTPLNTPHYVFGRGFGRVMHPNDGIIIDDPGAAVHSTAQFPKPLTLSNGRKRTHEDGPGENEGEATVQVELQPSTSKTLDSPPRPRRKVRFADASDEE